MRKNKLQKILAYRMDARRYVDVNSIEDYFDLPNSERTRFGFWYKKPYSLPGLLDDESGGWSDFSRAIRKEFPFQGWLREWFFTMDNPLYAFCIRTKQLINSLYYKTKCFFFPYHQKTRKTIPNTWTDVATLIVYVNFAMIC